MATMIDLVFGTRDQAGAVALRMQQFLADLGDELLTSAQHRVSALAEDRLTGIARAAVSKLGRWHTTLHSIANHLEDLETRTKHDIATAMNIDPRDL